MRFAMGRRKIHVYVNDTDRLYGLKLYENDTYTLGVEVDKDSTRVALYTEKDNMELKIDSSKVSNLVKEMIKTVDKLIGNENYDAIPSVIDQASEKVSEALDVEVQRFDAILNSLKNFVRTIAVKTKSA